MKQAIPPPGVRAKSEDSVSESSPENKADQPVVEQPSTEAKVPVAVVAKQRAETRAARAEAADLRQQLDAAKEQNPSLNLEALMEAIGKTIEERAQETFDKVAGPLAAEAAMLKSAINLGLNQKQAEALAQQKGATPGLSDQQALLLLKHEKPDLFPQQQRPARAVTGLPPGGDSHLRSAPEETDYHALAMQAREKKDFAEAQRLEVEAFRRQINAAMGRR